jgi:hypothetical protein
VAVPPAVTVPPPVAEPPPVAKPPPELEGTHEPVLHVKPEGHDTHMLPRAPQAVAAVPPTHWPLAQHPLEHVDAEHVGFAGEHDDDTAAETPSSAPSPNTLTREPFMCDSFEVL